MDALPSQSPVQAPDPGAGTSFRLVRNTPAPDTNTEGTLSFGDQSLFTLEPPWLQNKTGISCIPEGEYPVVPAMSPHFKRLMPQLQNVPDREAIEIHWGNYLHDTHGCILVGGILVNGSIYNSIHAFEQFWGWFEPLASKGPVTIRISSERTWSA